MNDIEDRLRAAARAAADTVPAGTAPPLRLPPRPGGHFSLPGRLGPLVGRMVIAPTAAAAAVAAVVTVSLVVTGGASRSGPARPGPAPALSGSVTSCATASAAPGAPPGMTTVSAALASVPPYYVVLTRLDASRRNAAVVRDTATGAVLATLTPPSPYGMFTQVTAAADDRTFVLAAAPPLNGQSGQPTGFFLLCLNAVGQPAAGLTALPITAEQYGTDVTGLALAPDASKLAIVVSTGRADDPGSSDIVIFTLATASATEWQWRTSGWIGNWKPSGSPLSWTANGQTLAFQAWQEHETPPARPLPPRLHKNVRVSLSTEVRLLDAEGPGGSLTSSTLAVEWTAPGRLLLGTNTIISPDGTKIACVIRQPSLSGVATEYSVSSGKIVAFLGVQVNAHSEITSNPAVSTPSVVTPVQNVLWSSTTGSTLIVATSTGAGVLTADQFTPIPRYPSLPAGVAW
jgi:hypothetical protein